MVKEMKNKLKRINYRKMLENAPFDTVIKVLIGYFDHTRDKIINFLMEKSINEIEESFHKGIGFKLA